METKLLQDIQGYLGEDYDKNQEPILLFCIKRAINSFKNKRNYPINYSEKMISEDMERFYSCIQDIVLFWFIKQGAEFQLSHSESNVNRTWENEEEIYSLHNVIPISRLV